MKPIHGPTNPPLVDDEVQRFASVIGLNPEKELRYRELHAHARESVTVRLRESHIHNYSIYLTELDGRKYLFSYFEYSGTDLDNDLQAIADDPETRRWWSETDPCQIQLPNRAQGANWTDMERVFYLP